MHTDTTAAARMLGACLLLLLAAACQGRAGGPGAAPDRTPLRLGLFANLTHAPAIAGLESGAFEGSAGTKVELQTRTFNAGPAAIEALLSGALDASFLGPSPAINAYVRSGGQAVRVVAGAASGGASLVVRPGIDGPPDLRGTRLASPQLGNTQDVALRTWLKAQGLRTTLEGGGDVSVVPQENAQTLQTFRSGQIDGAWVPEPWATRLVVEGGGKVLVDERDLWPGGRFVTTHLVVRTDYLARHPDAVRGLLRGEVETIDWLGSHPDEGARLVNEGLRKATGKPLPAEVISAAWPKLTFTFDPVATSLPRMAARARELGLLPEGKVTDVSGIYDLGLLEGLLRDAGRPQVLGR